MNQDHTVDFSSSWTMKLYTVCIALTSISEPDVYISPSIITLPSLPSALNLQGIHWWVLEVSRCSLDLSRRTRTLEAVHRAAPAYVYWLVWNSWVVPYSLCSCNFSHMPLAQDFIPEHWWHPLIVLILLVLINWLTLGDFKLVYSWLT